jgi:iron complex outermembrane receptor protein
MTHLYILLRTGCLIGILSFLSLNSYGQIVADTLELDEITVTATRIQQPLQAQPVNIQVIDSSLLRMQSTQTLGEILNSSSALFIKDNGPGGLATASQRGLSSEQLQVLWEGIPINHLMLGQTDLSLLPSSMFSNVQLSSGNPSTAFGGASMSGAIYLDSDLAKGNKFSYQQSAGSFGQWQSSLNGQYQSGRWQAGIHSTVSRAENDYEYFNRAYNRAETREHNRQEQENVMATLGYGTGESQFETKFWVQNSNNQIPGNVLTTNSRARKDDQALRWLSSYKTSWRGADITLKSYLDRVELNYFDPEIDVNSLSTFRRWLTSAGFDYRWSEHALIKGELSGGLSGVETNNYIGLKTRQQLSALINPEFSMLDHRLKMYPALRLDSYNDFSSVLSPSLGLNYALIFDKLYLRGQLSRDFNPPSFNALYWPQGGNPDLKPERGNSAEAGLLFKPERLTFSTFEMTAFYNQVDNGIRWNPTTNGVYSPENVDEITSKGVEGHLQNELKLPDQWLLKLDQSVSYTNAQITEARFSGDAVVGSQLRYVPKWNYQASLKLEKGMLGGLLQYRWTGRRYVTGTEDINSSLDPFRLLNASLQLKKQWAGVQFAGRAGVRNLLNTDYEIIQWYALPRRHYQFSLTATYQF